MKTWYRNSVAGATLLAAVAATALATVSAPADARGGGPFGQDMFRIAKLANDLDLSAEQRSRVEDIVESARDAARPYVDRLVVNHDELREAGRSPEFDEARVRGLADTQGDLMSEMIVLKARTHSEIRLVLTEEQRARFDERRGRRGGGHGPRF